MVALTAALIVAHSVALTVALPVALSVAQWHSRASQVVTFATAGVELLVPFIEAPVAWQVPPTSFKVG